MPRKAAKPAYKTIPLRPETWDRLQDYRMGGATYDDVLNDLMRALPIEKVAASVIREHKKRMRTFQGRDLREIKRDLGD